MTKPLVNPKIAKAGNVVISAEEQAASANSNLVLFTPQANLKNSNLCFFIIYRNLSPGKFVPVFKSEIKRPNAGVHSWNQVQIGATDLCRDDIERQIKIEFFQSNTSGKHKFLGAVEHMTFG